MFVVCLFIFFLFVISGGQEASDVPEPPLPKQEAVSFQITTNKADLNKVIQSYLAKEQKNNFTYQVIVTDEVEFNGRIPILQEEVDVKLTFDPIALENGDVELRQKSMTIGKFRLPPSIVLQFIQKNGSLPQWVFVQPKNEKVYLSLQHLKLKNDSMVAVKEINLKEDKIIFSLQIPIK